VDLVNHSELVISRAGYNMVNEILLTGAKAILVPESHGGGEQELRVQKTDQKNIKTITEDEVLSDGMEHVVLDSLRSEVAGTACKFDKYAIGRQIIDDLEGWKSRSKSCK